jgi:hypothetical protein
VHELRDLIVLQLSDHVSDHVSDHNLRGSCVLRVNLVSVPRIPPVPL